MLLKIKGPMLNCLEDLLVTRDGTQCDASNVRTIPKSQKGVAEGLFKDS